jgi:spore germination cell wall hydrolase CwlJ-like protein
VIAESILCLALNLYHEARGEGPEGMMAVAQVTLNRVHHPDWPDTICEVVYQEMQFSWTNGHDMTPPKGSEAWTYTKAITIDVLMGEAHSVLDHRALFYHAASVQPAWADDMLFLGQIGEHKFYAYHEPEPRPDDVSLRPRPRPETLP